MKKSIASMYRSFIFHEVKYSPAKILANEGDVYYKIVPKGRNIDGPSPYYLSQSEYNWIKANPTQLEQMLGLPLEIVDAEYDVYTITSKVDNNVLFESTIASTEQSALSSSSVTYSTTGGKTQSIIINNNDNLYWLKSTSPIESISPKNLPKIGN